MTIKTKPFHPEITGETTGEIEAIPPGTRGGNDREIEAIPPGNRGGNDN
jgi:hypothetical protein